MIPLANHGKKGKMVKILQGNDWSSSDSLTNADGLDLRKKDDLCTILFDGFQKQPEVFEVCMDVFKNKTKLTLSGENTIRIRELIGTLEVKSDPELMECIRQSQIDKRNGKTRKYEEIAREAGLRL